MTAPKRLFFLDFIRALSVLLIILYHFDLEILSEHPGARIAGKLVVFNQAIGDLGVTLFIIISGAALMVSTDSRFSVSDFFKKRVLAIFPSYWISYIAVSALLFLLRGAIAGDGEHWKFLLTLTGLDGFLFYKIPNYYLIGEWFTGFILIIYVAFPVLRIGVMKRPVLTGLTVLVLSLVLHHFYNSFFLMLENRNPLMRLPEFVFGMCFSRYILRQNTIAFVVSLALLVLFFFWTPPFPPVQYGLVLGIAVFCVLAVMAERMAWPSSVVNAVTFLSKYAFLAFLVHHQIIYILLPHVDASHFSVVEVHYLFLIVLFLSFIAAKLLSRPVNILTEILRGKIFSGDTATSTGLMKWTSRWSIILGVAVFLSTLYGVIHFYSPIPWYDEWDGYIGFYRNITTGYLAGWWIPHMEHRLLLPRAFFWADIVWFGGQHYALFLAEQALQTGMVLLVWREYARGQSFKAPLSWTIGLPLALMFSWVQVEVFKWGFELQVIAVYFFALWAAAQYSHLNSRPIERIGIALVLAALAEISMGNGMLAFAMLLGQGFIARRALRELGLIGLVGAALWTIYFIGYTKPPVVHPVLSARQFAENSIQFFLVFLGNPLALVQSNLRICMMVGGATLAFAGWMTVRLYLRKQITPYRLFLIGGYGFVVLSGLAAMSGRAWFGPAAAAMSRYTTGPLLAWVLLAFLAFDVLADSARRQWVVFGSVAMATLLASYQYHVRDDSSYLYDWKLAVLAHKIGLDRPDLDALLFPAEAHDHFTSLADFAAQNGVALYGRGWLRDAGSVVYRPDARDSSWCRGSFDGTETGKNGLVARGWAYSSQNSRNMLVVLTDAAGKTVGYGVTGKGRPDVAAQIGRDARVSGWIGFVQPVAGPLTAYAYYSGRFCLLNKASNGNFQ